MNLNGVDIAKPETLPLLITQMLPGMKGLM